MATHSNVLAWRIPGRGESGGLPSLGSHRVRHDWSDLAAAAAAKWGHLSIKQKNYWKNLKGTPSDKGETNIAAAAAKSLQSCPTLWDPIDGGPLGSPVPGILQARTLEWVAISFSNAWKWKVKVKSLSCFRLFPTPRTAAYQAPLTMGFSRQEYWSGLPLPSPHKAWGAANFF